MNIMEYLKDNVLFLDGGMGTILQSKGLKPGELPEIWNITHADIVTDIHKSYYDSGSNVVSTNTFGANILKFTEVELEEIIKSAVNNAKRAREMTTSAKEKFIALDLGPSGKLLKPYGDLDFEDAVTVFAKTVEIGVKYGVDLIYIETMNDSYETKAALLGAKESCDLPVFVSNAYGADGKLLTGASPEAMVAMLEGMGADAIGANCSLGPKQLENVVERLLDCASVPVILKPNAGLPKHQDGKTVYDVEPEEFAGCVAKLIEKGVRIAGGCCGTTPEYIKSLVKRADGIKPIKNVEKNRTVVSSYTHCVEFKDTPVLIGERINPTGKKRLKQALFEEDMPYILQEGINQQELGVHILDVNVGIPEIDEAETLQKVICELQSVTNLPLQIDTANPLAMERALRRYNGKAMINSVNGKQESMEAIFPLVKKYGGVVVALTLDENGIPDTADGRIAIAEKIINTAQEYGIDKKDIVFDTLAMTVSADQGAAVVTLKALDYIKNVMGCHTSLGVSNVSFGLPSRDAVNSTFFASALERGLSAAIMNPNSVDMMKTYYAFRTLHGYDENCSDYIEFMQNVVQTSVATVAKVQGKEEGAEKTQLQNAIVKGFKEKARELTEELLKTEKPLDIVQNEVIPALDIVGKGFEEGKVYLPQLLMSAEAAKSAFEKVKGAMESSKDSQVKRCRIVIATVHGDIHDIGKNIVKLLLENYGFQVTDLGKDVPPQVIVDKAVEIGAPIVALSALMTTTVPAMEETIKLLKKALPECKTVVGGAVLTEEYAKAIGADKYASDAMETVRFAEEIDR